MLETSTGRQRASAQPARKWLERRDPSCPIPQFQHTRTETSAQRRVGEHLYNNKPVGINVIGNVAIAEDYYTRIVKDAEGKANGTSGRWADIVMKQGDKWVLIGDHGGRTSEEEDCE